MYNNRPTKKSNNTPIIIIVVALIILLFVGVGLLLFMLLRPTADTKTTPQGTSQTVTNAAGVASSVCGRITISHGIGTNVNTANNQTNPDTLIYIPAPVSAPVPVPYGNPSNAKQRFMNNAAEIENYEYRNLYNVSNQTDKNLHTRVTFEKWDVLLNDVYDYLKSIMSSSEFKTLDNDELNWIKRKEAAISNIVSRYKGTARETEARYMTGTSYTKERCYYLISLIPDSNPQPPVHQTPPPQPKPSSGKANQYRREASQIESYESNIYSASNQTDRNLHARVAFEKWDVLLNDVYNFLKSNMSSSEFKALDDDELAWIKRKEAAISSAVAQHKGTAKETEVRYTTGIDYTKERCYYLISLADQY